jgi:DNA repair protein RadC
MVCSLRSSQNGKDRTMPSLRKIKLSFVKERNITYSTVKSADDAVKTALSIFDFLRYETQEVFCVLHLDPALNVIGYHEAFRGGIDNCIVDNKVIFRAALLSGAVSIILVHNHPSGNVKPSKADSDITIRIKEAATYLNIKLLDHIIVSTTGSYSFEQEGNLRGL